MNKYTLTSKGIHIKSDTSTEPLSLAEVCRKLNTYSEVIKNQRGELIKATDCLCDRCDTYSVYDMINICQDCYQTKDDERDSLRNQIRKMSFLVKSSFIEGHNFDYYQDIREPVLSYWLTSDSIKKLNKELNKIQVKR